MFLLLINEKYSNFENKDIDLSIDQLKLLLTVIVEFIKHITKSFNHAGRNKKEYEEIL